MRTIRLETFIRAPRERCFDLSLSVDHHMASMSHTGERAVTGVTSGMMRLGDTVTWEAKHFGVTQRLTVRITAVERPRWFVDEQVPGAFARMRHRHEFAETAEGTLMTEEFSYEVPFGWLGLAFDRLVLERYMRRLLQKRNDHLTRAAESGADDPAV